MLCQKNRDMGCQYHYRSIFQGKFGCRLKATNEEGGEEEVPDGVKEGILKQEPRG